MRISSISNFSLHPNYMNKQSPKVSFGEYDDGGYSPCGTMTEEEYMLKQRNINEQYDQQRSAWLKTCDDLEISTSGAWQELERIEQNRECALSNLESEYNNG